MEEQSFERVEAFLRSSYVSAADVEPAEHAFLLGDTRFPIGEISIIAGAGGVGKGQLACAHIALASRGYNLAGAVAGEPQTCLFITAEDTAPDVRRRLDRSLFKADMSRVLIQDKTHSFNFGLDLSKEKNPYRLESLILLTGATLVYLDPLQAFVGEFTDLSRQNQVRRIMHALAALAERTRCCIVLLMHLNKRQQIVNAADLLCGSSDIVNASRSAMLLTNDFRDGDPDRRYLFHIKSNHARNAGTLELRVAAAGNSIIGTSDVTAEEYVQAVNTRRAAKAARGEPNYEQMFYSGIEQMIAEGKLQSTFREFIDRFAPSFQGRPKYVMDDIAIRVEERLGYTIQTKTSNSSAVKVDGDRGFRLTKL